MTDPIADMLSRIRNAQAAGQASTSFPYSKIKEAVVEILQAHHYLASYRIEGDQFKVIVADLADRQISEPVRLERVSKPGRRVYSPAKQIPAVLGGRGLVIVSTPGGVMTGAEARKKGLGGELICRVY